MTGSRNIPYLGVAAHTSWAAKNGKLIPKLYAAYKEAADWVGLTSRRRSQMIVRSGNEERKAIAELVRSNERLGMNVRWASEYRRRSLRLRSRSLDRVPAFGPFDRDHLRRSEQ